MIPPGSSTSSTFRQPSGHHSVSQQQSSALAARIASKKAELDNLKQLRDMSGALAIQMQVLEQKIGTLKDGTEAKTVTIQRPIEQKSNTGSEGNMPVDSPMPATLVRIPTEQAGMARQ
ncbi:hypothetical protein ETB97_000984 [Aspergillus alliaceus]|uniref:DASH complex subunit DAD2 n=1 Tax=Petromyces alliaceus TaxID=209559 RepID=A0A8H6A4V8_PETAA|nr:hypothetical protein ETB97_000984 [Aspergillus burnettii]